MNQSVAIILARGKSKRIPRKNIKNFFGRAVISYPIEAALESGCFEDVIVSTDCSEIAEVARAAGASVPFFRSPETSGDHATTVHVLREVFARLEEEGRSYKFGCCLYAVTPFLRATRLHEAMEMLVAQEQVETVMSALRYPCPIERGFRLNEGIVDLVFPQHIQGRTQDFPPVYHDAAQFYLFRTREMLQRGTLIGPASAAVILPASEAHDIDDEEDWLEAEFKFRVIQENKDKTSQ